jgi:hypothetical protein
VKLKNTTKKPTCSDDFLYLIPSNHVFFADELGESLSLGIFGLKLFVFLFSESGEN